MDIAPLAPYVAAEIRAEMARRHITSAALALRVGRPKQTVHRWTAGQTAIALDDIPLVCAAIGTGVDELMSAAIAHRAAAGELTGPVNIRWCPGASSDRGKPGVVRESGMWRLGAHVRLRPAV